MPFSSVASVTPAVQLQPKVSSQPTPCSISLEAWLPFSFQPHPCSNYEISVSTWPRTLILHGSRGRCMPCTRVRRRLQLLFLLRAGCFSNPGSLIRLCPLSNTWSLGCGAPGLSGRQLEPRAGVAIPGEDQLCKGTASVGSAGAAVHGLSGWFSICEFPRVTEHH